MSSPIFSAVVASLLLAACAPTPADGSSARTFSFAHKVPDPAQRLRA